jgi:hypothetical protein
MRRNIMNTRERQNDPRDQHQRTPAAPGGEGLDAARQDAERLFAAGDDAIERALSADSDAFLAANRQRGGQ